MKTVILYVFHKITPMVKYFDKRIFKKDGYDFIYVVNNDKITDEQLSELSLCNLYKLVKRKNIGNDFGAWSDTILEYELQDKYDNFIFINSSVYGPLFNEEENCNWCDILLNGLTEDVKLFGSTINGHLSVQSFHVQSFVFCMKSDTLKYLIKKGIFKKEIICKTKKTLIIQHEVEMSKLLLDNGWNIGCLLGHMKNMDFRKKELGKKRREMIDLQCKKYLLNKILKPKEVLFVKGNRDMTWENISKFMNI